MQKRPFRRTRQHRRIGGVCGGLAYAFGIQPVIVRVLTILASIFSFSLVFWAYLILWIVADEWDTDPSDFEQVTQEIS